jgi:murein DD-endopeptidase MepM/ murein hydrolase activator NlpD
MLFINPKSIMLRLAAISLALGGSSAQARTFASVPVDLQVPVAPIPFKAGGKFQLLYELHITSFRAKSLELTRLEILDDTGKSTKNGDYTGDELKAILEIPGAPEDIPDKRVIGGGMRAVAFLQISAETEADLPRAVHHRLYFKQNDPNDHTDRVVEGGKTVVLAAKPLVIGPPVRGEGWIALEAPENSGSHRRTIVVVDGQAHIAQRFAVDWSRLGADGQAFRGDPADNANWTPYGAEVLAVADGMVVDVNDGVPENNPASDKKAVPITLETVAGNYIVLDLGAGHFALYAHLQPKSLRIKMGDKVRRGQVLALLGNSGQADAPHLHFHITDGNSPLGAEGIPFVFESFEQVGIIPSLKVLTTGEGWKPNPETAAISRPMEMPVKNAVIRFP